MIAHVASSCTPLQPYIGVLISPCLYYYLIFSVHVLFLHALIPVSCCLITVLICILMNITWCTYPAIHLSSFVRYLFESFYMTKYRSSATHLRYKYYLPAYDLSFQILNSTFYRTKMLTLKARFV